MTSRRPYLVRGAELRRFLIARRDEARCQLGAGQLFCLSCRAARHPMADQVTYVAQTPKAGRIQGHCGTCGACCARMVSAARLPEITQHLNVA